MAAGTTGEAPSFSFGENWRDYLTTVTPSDIQTARRDIEHWLGAESVVGRSVLDIGSGSGIHSLAFHLLGAGSVTSLDRDPHSVEATRTVWREAGEPERWTVLAGSVLDERFLRSLGQFDLVYSWGVLHHTGAMWPAIENSFQCVVPGGKIWLALYAKGPRFHEHLALKERYNSASQIGKRYMVGKTIGRRMLGRLRRRQNPFTWNQKKIRGMNVYHDIIDWLGGLPYEVADADEVVRFARDRSFVLERIQVKQDGGCSIYVLSKV